MQRADANGASVVSVPQSHIRPNATWALGGQPFHRMRAGMESHPRRQRCLRSTLPESSASMSADEVADRGVSSSQSSGSNSGLDFLGRAQVLVPTSADDDTAAESVEQLEGGPADWLASHAGLRDR